MKTRRKRNNKLIHVMIVFAVIFSVSLCGAPFAGLLPDSALAEEQQTADDLSGYVTDTNKDVKIESKAGIVLDSAHDIILYDKNADKKMYPASCTKVLTALVVLDNVPDLNKEVTVSQEAIDSLEEGSSHIALVPGEKVTIKDLLYGLLLESGNDCANVLAEEVGGNTEGFAEMMNAKAKEIGANDSHFVNPHGWYNKDHYTTAHDLAIIMDECVKNEKFVKIDSALKYKIKKTNKSPARELWNSHRMIPNKYAYYEGVLGGKTGFTKESKCCLITYAKKNGMDLITVVMRNGTPHGCVVDTTALLDYYFNKHHVVSSEESLPDYNSEGSVKVGSEKVKYAEKDAPDVIVPRDTQGGDLIVEKDFDKDLDLPVSKDQKIGTAYIVCDNKMVGKTDIVSTETVVSKIPYIIGGAAILIAAFVLCVTVMMKRKRKRRKRIFS